MGDQFGKTELHVVAGLGPAQGFAVEIDAERQVHPGAVPGPAQLVRRHRDRRERGRRLALEEAEALGKLRRDQVAQGDVVDQHEQPDMAAGLVRADAHRHVIGDHRHLAFHVDAPVLGAGLDVVGRPEEGVGAALIHQRVGEEARRHLGAARLAHQLDVIEIGAGVEPLIGAGQRRGQRRGIEGERPNRAAFIKRAVDRVEHRRGARPVLERRLQGGGGIGHRGGGREIAGDHHQGAVTRRRLQGCELHSAASAFTFQLST